MRFLGMNQNTKGTTAKGFRGSHLLLPTKSAKHPFSLSSSVLTPRIMFKTEGIYAAIITPFNNDGSVDGKGIKKLVETLDEAGINGILAISGTGESTALSQSERKQVVDNVVDSAKCPVVIGVLNPGLGDAIDLAKHAKDAGADAILLIPPYYGKPTQSDISAYYAKLAETVDISILIYNIPYKTGINIEPQTVVELAGKNSNIIGIKECSRDLAQLALLIKSAPKAFSIFVGEDDIFFPCLALGATSGMLATACLFPKPWLKLLEYWKAGEISEARKLHYDILPFVKLLYSQTNPMGIKVVMNAERMPAGPTRQPIPPASNEYKDRLLESWKNFLQASSLRA